MIFQDFYVIFYTFLWICDIWDIFVTFFLEIFAIFCPRGAIVQGGGGIVQGAIVLDPFVTNFLNSIKLTGFCREPRELIP